MKIKLFGYVLSLTKEDITSDGWSSGGFTVSINHNKVEIKFSKVI